MFEVYKYSLKDHTKVRQLTIDALRLKCKAIGNIKISRLLEKDDSYVSNILYNKKSVSDENILKIINAIEKMEVGNEVD